MKVIQWGTGAVGLHAMRFVLDHPELDLVGVKCHTDAKVGKDAGSIAGRPGEFPLALPGGTGFALDDAVVMTAARCVNAVAAVVGAPPGYRTVNELAAFGARYGFRR
jgi:hypothetical protein